jgi:hypothetical protein
MNRRDRSLCREKINGITVQTTRKKYSASLPTQITGSYRHPVPPEGRIAIVTDVGRDAVDTDALLTNSA